MKVTAVRYLTLVGLLSLLIGGGLYLAAIRRDRPKHAERTAAATAPTTNAANEVSHPQEPSGSNPPVSPPDAIKRPNVFGLSGPVQLDDVPDGRFRNELSRLNEPARRQALEKLGRLRVPLNDVASLSVDRDGQLFYHCNPPPLPPVPPQTSSARLEAQIGSPVGVPDKSVAAASVAITSPPVRHSRLGASKVIYLDFNGLTISGTGWNNELGTVGDADYRPAVASYVAKPFDTDGDASTFSDGEQAVIAQIWERVAEDFRPFDVDVTTEEPAGFTSNTGRILITTNVDSNGVNMPSSTAAGVAYIGVFGNSRYASYYSPALVYFNQLSKYGPYIAEAASHEIGHNLSLSHDGTATGDEYYDGHGTGENSWGAIMGGAYDRNVTQWSKGEYYNANNTQDDLALIAGHLSYMPADGTDSNATANPLTVSGLTVSGSGIISQTGEADRFSFVSGAGAISFNVLPTRSASLPYGANLDVALELYDSSGTLVASSNVDGVTTAALNTTVAGGTYYLRVLGAGSGTPLNNPPSGYTSYASVGQYTISGTVVSTTPVAPSFTSQPTSQTVYAGQSAQFTVAASGYPVPSFQWQRLPAGSGTWADLANGGSYSGATTVTLAITGSTTAMNGDQFRCVATSSAGTATSAGATITVNATTAPSFTLQPLSQTITAGLSVTFTAAASGAPTPTYQWKKEGININGATGSSYTVANVAAGHAGNYTVVATNLVNSATSNIAVLTVQSLPVFTTQPGGMTVTVGSSATFISEASGSPAPTYQWKKNDVAISGATGSSYTIVRVAMTDSGNYAVVATSSAGSATSYTAVLTVWSIPLFITQPASQTVTAGSSVTLTAAAIALPIPTYQWKKDGVNISGATGGTYTIANATASNGGNYTVVATNSAGSATSSIAAVEVQYSPVFTIQPLSQTVSAGNYVTIAAAASGVPAPAYQWQKGGVNIGGATKNSYSIANIVTGDSGNYAVVATNSIGSATSSTAILTVNAAGTPFFTTQPLSQSVITGRSVTFTVAASGIPDPTYQWQKGGANISGATSSIYYIASVVADNAGDYTVVVTNSVGSVTSEVATLTVKDPKYTFSVIPGASGHAPSGVAVDQMGNVYFADYGTIRKMTPDGVVTTLAGTAGSTSSADGTGSTARFISPYGVAVDGMGNVYVADQNDSTIRKITAAGVVTTFAGKPGNSGSTDGTGSAARFCDPTGVAVDGTGNVYVTDQANHTIRKITVSGVVTTFAGTVGSAGSVDGVGSAARFYYPHGVAVDRVGNVFVVDSSNYTIRKITPEGVVSTIAGAAGSQGSVDGTGASAQFYNPLCVAVDGTGNLYVTDYWRGTIREITPGGVVTTLAVTSDSVYFSELRGIALDGVGNIFVANDYFHTVCWGAVASPSLTSTNTAGGTLRRSFNYTVTFSDTLGGYSASGLPAGLSFDPPTGVISGTPTVVGTFPITLTAINGAGSTTATLTLTVNPATALSADFNHDNRSDILWTNTATGDRAIWFMNGTAIGTNAFAGTVPPNWIVSGTGDLNGDGKADIFWTNTTTGDRAAWLMNGNIPSMGGYLGAIPVEWVVSGTGDFDGDGKADILWTNTITGERSMWLMNGLTASSGASLGVVPVAWAVSGTGDFNGDGKADIMLSNTSTGDRVIWFMNGATISTNAFAGTVLPAWLVSGVGDFDGDGKADIFWTNTLTGDRAAWLMNGNIPSLGGYLGAIPVEWVISATGDYNGDGKTDILWTNTATGERSMWLMNGLTAAGGASLGVVPVAWVPAP